MNLLLIDEGLSLYDKVKDSSFVDMCEVYFSESTNSILKYIKTHIVYC